MSDSLKEKREIEQSEATHKTAKIISGLFPGGSSLYELYKAIVKPLHEKRFDEWVSETTMRLHKLETEGKINLEELSQTEEFNSIITKATLLAQQTHQEEKVEAFRNIVVNSALDLKKISDLFDWTNHFLHIVDRISPMHILLLKTFRYPKDEVDRKGISLEDGYDYSSKELFFEIYPELKDRVSLINQCWKELERDGFITSNEAFVIESGKSSYPHTKEKLVSKTTDFGNKFLDMIESEE